MLDKFCELANTGLTPILVGPASVEFLDTVARKISRIDSVCTLVLQKNCTLDSLEAPKGGMLHLVLATADGKTRSSALPFASLQNTVVGYVHNDKIIEINHDGIKEETT